MLRLSDLIHGTMPHAQFARYLAIGSTVFCIDVGSFQLLVRAHVLLPVAVTIAYVVAISMHFALNKYWNFRTFDRTFQSQLRTYLVVAGTLWLTTLGIVEAGVHLANLPPIAAKILAVVLNIPLGFLCHKYLTFGGGILASLGRLRGRRRDGKEALH